MQITGGRVSFSRTVKPADYESKAATVELTFLVEEGEDHDPVLQAIGSIVQAKALELVGLKPAGNGSAGAPRATKPAGKTKADLEAEAAAALGGNPTSGKAAKTPPKAAAPKTGAAISTGEPRGEADGSAHDAASVEDVTSAADPAAIGDDDLMSAAPAEITDADLTSRITQHNAKIKNPVAIRQLIGKYVKAPGQARDIPQDKRAAFLAELEKV